MDLLLLLSSQTIIHRRAAIGKTNTPSSSVIINAAFHAAVSRAYADVFLPPAPDDGVYEDMRWGDEDATEEYDRCMEPRRAEDLGRQEDLEAFRVQSGGYLDPDEEDEFIRCWRVVRAVLLPTRDQSGDTGGGDGGGGSDHGGQDDDGSSESGSTSSDNGSTASSAWSWDSSFILGSSRSSGSLPDDHDYFEASLSSVQALSHVFEEGKNNPFRFSKHPVVRYHLELLRGSGIVGLGEDQDGTFHPILEPLLQLVPHADGLVFAAADAAACDLPSVEHYLSLAKPYARLLYIFDDTKPGAGWEAWSVFEVLEMIRRQRPRRGRFIKDLILGHARRLLLRIAAAFTPVIQRNRFLRTKTITQFRWTGEGSGSETAPAGPRPKFGMRKDGTTIDEPSRFARTADISLERDEDAIRQFKTAEEEMKKRKEERKKEEEDWESNKLVNLLIGRAAPPSLAPRPRIERGPYTSRKGLTQEEKDEIHRKQCRTTSAQPGRPVWSTGRPEELGTHESTLGKRTRTDMSGWTEDEKDEWRREQSLKNKAREPRRGDMTPAQLQRVRRRDRERYQEQKEAEEKRLAPIRRAEQARADAAHEETLRKIRERKKELDIK